MDMLNIFLKILNISESTEHSVIGTITIRCIDALTLYIFLLFPFKVFIYIYIRTYIHFAHETVREINKTAQFFIFIVEFMT